MDPDRANIPHYLKAGLYAISIWIWAHPRPLQTSNSQMPGFLFFGTSGSGSSPTPRAFCSGLLLPIIRYTLHSKNKTKTKYGERWSFSFSFAVKRLQIYNGYMQHVTVIPQRKQKSPFGCSGYVCIRYVTAVAAGQSQRFCSGVISVRLLRSC